MKGLQRTYELLGRTDNRAAVAVLADGLQSKVQSIRSLAISTLVARPEREAADVILQNWGSLNDDDHAAIRGHASQINQSVKRCFANNKLLPSAIAACSTLRLYDQVDALANLVEKSSGLAIAKMAAGALVDLSMPIGEDARRNRPVSTVRGPYIDRLVESVRRFPQHRNEMMVDAFLIASTWSDVELRTWIIRDDAIGRLIQSRLRESEHPGIVDLLAGYLRRRRIPECVLQSVTARSEEIVGDAILRSIGDSPPAITRKHLSKIGIPRSLRGGVNRCVDIIPANRAAMVHLYSATGDSVEDVVPVAMHALHHWKQPDVVAAVVLALSRCPVPSVEWMMRAAIPVAKLLEADPLPQASFENIEASRSGQPQAGSQQKEAASPDDIATPVKASQTKIQPQAPRPSLQSLGADDLDQLDSRIVAGLIDLLGHRDVGIAKAARRLLAPLHADTMLSRFEELRERSRRNLGRVVMRIDPGAIDRVRDTLRHPVLDRRLEAIGAADALSLVEVLAPSFVRIVKDDHQEARIRAAQAMANATDPVTESLLEDLMRLPESQVRDAAEAALASRRGKDSKSKSNTASPLVTPGVSGQPITPSDMTVQ